MEVKVLGATEAPMDLVSMAAGCCYGKRNISHKRVLNCYRLGHMSVFEHASVTILVEGISRACMAQLTRHRLVSFCVESQRYNKYVLNGDDWYIMPTMADGDRERWFRECMEVAAFYYVSAVDDGTKPEDARYLLPEATKTNLVMTCNVRELFHLFDMRLDKSAQWGIRNLAVAIKDAVANHGEQWCALMDMYESEGK